MDRVDASVVCPKGHKLPKTFSGMNCTPVFCAAQEVVASEALTEKDKKRRTQAKRSIEKAEYAIRLAKEMQGELANTEKVAEAEETQKLERYSGQHRARLAYTKTPSDLHGADAEEFADKKIVHLLPAAVAELEFQLKFGDDKQRMDAATKVLDATGRGKREMLNGGSGPLIILTGNSVIQPPWRKPSATIDVTPAPTTFPDSGYNEKK